ncbi:MAG: hypothetical protein FGM14_16845 [Flavobacteriales bacterium]|nr:hypothetical protein [Flavobacteriales bacterium]
MIVSEIKLYELLKAKLGEKEAEAFVYILETKVDQKFEDAKQVLATKEDIARLDLKIAETKVDLIKWMVGFWIAQMAAIIGLYLNK